MNEEWDKLWEDKPDTLGDYIISDWGFEQWINRMERAGDKLIERVVYLEGLTDGDVKIITQLQVENEKLKHIIATGYCGECDVLKEENNQLREKQRETQFLLSCESDLYKDCKLDLGKYMKKLEAIRDVVNNAPDHTEYPRFGDFYEVYVEWVLALKQEALGDSVLKKMQKEEKQ